ncbi:MAG: DUF1573 domain-containing protein [bacterium]|nr:DUF1573 domain-containing protein [bacterium]
MKQNVLIFIGIVAFVVIGFFILNGGSSDPATEAISASILETTKPQFDFGTISMNNGNVSYKFEVENTGSESIVVQKVYTSCMCTTAKITDARGKTYGPYGMPGHTGLSGIEVEINPGEKAIVEAIFDPAAHGPSGVGLANRTIFLETNSTQTPKIELNFTAMVTN